MADGFIQILHHSCGNDIIFVFCCPVFFCSRYGAGHSGTGVFIPTDFHLFFLQCLTNHRQEGIFQTFMHQQAFAGIANAGTLCFGIDNNAHCFFQVSAFIHINMAVAHTCLNDRNGTVLHNILNESCAASGNEQIQIAIQTHHFVCGFPIGILYNLYAGTGQTFFFQCFLEYGNYFFIGADGFFTAAENNCTAGFQAQTESVCCYIGTGFKNDADHAHGHTFLTDNQSIIQCFHG